MTNRIGTIHYRAYERIQQLGQFASSSSHHSELRKAVYGSLVLLLIIAAIVLSVVLIGGAVYAVFYLLSPMGKAISATAFVVVLVVAWLAYPSERIRTFKGLRDDAEE